MDDRPLVSVILPHLNEPDLLTCLRSLDGQRGDGVPFEIIVVDNGSRELPETAVSLVSEVRLLKQPTPGPGPARNLGASEARAPILAFVDADCVASPNWVATIYRYFDEHPDIDFIGGDIRIRPADASRLTAVEAYENVYSYRARIYVERHGFAATGNMAVRASVFRAVGPFGGIGTMEDTEWGQRATGMGFHIAYVPEARVYTPSCRSFAELARRWDRHVAHEFADIRDKPLGMARWVAKSVAMAASPAAEAIKLMRSDRVDGWRERLLALGCVTRVRLYRARRMLGLALHDDAAGMVDMWNRENR
ncbi:glycosyltransferase [Devosia epidermidihirudinis]|uniref:Glycosyltransferase n=1 Tax=Devosia epidermidihirudinis TaxID=1293439 RepID=A0A0F5QDN1_9HYPH|nr:glycosyltransferase family 2 protein [Devosia epidermidihirudinis]KKC38833.1 glycosyltransferase [Devosia epidermidihirudinis]